MKQYTREDIKVGSVWRDNREESDFRCLIDDVSKDLVCYHYIHIPFNAPQHYLGTETVSLIEDFLRWYHHIYMVEGFEV